MSDVEQRQMADAQKRLNEAMQGLYGVSDLPILQGGRAAQEFTASTQAIMEACTAILGSQGKPDLIRSSGKNYLIKEIY